MNASTPRLGLYGGSFNPVHLGHLLVAQAALEELNLSRVFFLPAAQSPFKPDAALASGHDRLQLLRLALAGRPPFELDDQELTRGGVSYAIETARGYRRRYPDAALFYLIGADHAARLTEWREAEALAELVTMVVVPRPGDTPQPLPAPFRGGWLRGFPVAISASQIRERVRLRQPVDLLVPPDVAEAIRNKGLYL